MLSQFQASYQRVEQSLQRLTDSIAAYNPSTSAADELVAANEVVDEDLEQRMRTQLYPIPVLVLIANSGTASNKPASDSRAKADY